MSMLAGKLKTSRKKAGLTQEQVANALGLSIGAISGYERGYRKPDPELLKRIADLYGVTTDYLLDDDLAIQEAQADYSNKVENAFEKIVYLLKDEHGSMPPEAMPLSIMAILAIYAQIKGVPLVPSVFQSFQYPKENMTPEEVTKLVADMDKIIESDFDNVDIDLVKDIMNLSSQDKNIVKAVIDALKNKENAATDDNIDSQTNVRRRRKIKSAFGGSRIAAHRDDNPMDDLPEEALQSIESAKAAYLNEPQQFKKK